METHVDAQGRTWYSVHTVGEWPFGSAKGRPSPLTLTATMQAALSRRSCRHGFTRGRGVCGVPRRIGDSCHKNRPLLDVQACIRCPLHKFVISIETGESFYQPVEFERSTETGKIVPKPLPWRSHGVKQRTHLTKVEGQRVWISLLARDRPVASDKFAKAFLNRA
ncbi:rieske [2fe-2s] domain-containing protein [Besnoitia besnoiti]|uniref:Rieske [2fe-2s] domain-containing protein n=1 Tax=Besnoitia besnoiti TaxID=94643 RepID=A0A2A9M0J6_BESBE|nr:rieske [2fe-2s] domain-containing protein [Besnoitia besnoiti]PFH31479.1 rieske [2fe-2s] domain-containing protein [Besnoitia besnoiti]